MKRKKRALVTVNLDDGARFYGLLWPRGSSIDPQEYIIRLFETLEAVERFIPHSTDRYGAVFHMTVVPFPEPPAPPPDVESAPDEATGEDEEPKATGDP